MTDRIAPNPLRHHPNPADVTDDGAAGKTDQAGSTKAASGTDSRGAALLGTPPEAGSSSLGAAALVKRHRAARRAMMGADAAAFAERFAHTPISKRFHFIKTELERHPELADTAIAVRLQGAPSHDRALVHAVLARTKATGFTRYAIAERVLAKVRPLNADEREEVLSQVRSGKSLSSAVEIDRSNHVSGAERKQATASTDGQIAASTQKIDEEIRNAEAHSDKMYQLFRQVSPLSLEAEYWVGGVNLYSDARSAGVNGGIAAAESLVERSTQPLKDWADDPGRQAAYLSGDVTAKIHDVNQRYMQYAAAHDQYVSQSRRLKRAIQSQDPASEVDAATKREAAQKAMDQAAKAFKPVAEDAIKAQKHLDGDVLNAMINTATLGLGGAVKRATEDLGPIAKHGIRIGVQVAKQYAKLGAQETLKK